MSNIARMDPKLPSKCPGLTQNLKGLNPPPPPLKEVIEKYDPLNKRCLEAKQLKGASSWLTAMPLKQL